VEVKIFQKVLRGATFFLKHPVHSVDMTHFIVIGRYYDWNKEDSDKNYGTISWGWMYTTEPHPNELW